MSNAPIVYPARQLAKDMKVSGAMVRVYAAAFENITGERVEIIGRDGRHFTEEQRAVLMKARALISDNPGLTVDAAMRAALGRAEVVAKLSGGLDSEMLRAALHETVAAPLTAQLEALRAEVAALRSELAEVKALPASERPAVVEGAREGGESPAAGNGAAEGQPDGPMVRAVRWLETRLRGGQR